MKTLINTLIEYNYWAHRLVWAEVEKLSDEQFEKDLSYSWGTIKAQVVHTMSAEWMWLSRLKGTSPKAMFNPADFPDRAAIRTRWDEIEQEVRAFVADSTDETLDGNFSYTTTSGNSHTQKAGEIVMHIINHGTDHRAQTLAMMHLLGADTIEQDLIFYLRERVETS